MIYPIYVYGSSVLRTECKDIDRDYPELGKLISDMFETTTAANGVGLAAPQIGLPIRLFCVDLTEWEDDPDAQNMTENTRRTFINAEIYERSDDQEPFKEGCLSLPGINEDVLRPSKIRVRYRDENFVLQDREFDGMWARVIQHEYDHIHGKVFTDHLQPLRKSLIKSKLAKMTRGVFSAKYRCKVGQ